MLTAANYAETCEEVTPFTKELLLLPPLGEAQNHFPRAGPTAAPLDRENLLPVEQKEPWKGPLFFRLRHCCPEILCFCVIPGNMNSEFR